MKTETKIKPLVTDEEILEFVHSLNGERKHDQEICIARGMPRFVGDVMRRIFGKVKNPKKLHSKEFKEKVIAEYKEGRPVNQIAEDNGLTPAGIYSILHLNGIETERWHPWSKIKKMKLVHMRDEQKLTWREIGQYFEKTPTACHLQYQYIKGIQPRQRRKNEEHSKEVA